MQSIKLFKCEFGNRSSCEPLKSKYLHRKHKTGTQKSMTNAWNPNKMSALDLA